jgi:negative regulator of flagellin synthesis FlgM
VQCFPLTAAAQLENAMKIGNPLDKPGLVPGTPARASNDAAAKSGAGTAAAPAGSTVALSTAATALLRSESAAAASADFDGAKVERISGAITRGEFTVNPEAIADKLIANAQELLSRPH